MKTLKIVVVAVACVFFAGAAAGAAELVTPAVVAPPNDTILCMIVNLTNQEHAYVIEQIDSDGSVGSIDDDHTVLAGGSRSFGVVNNGPGNMQRYCVFTVEGVAKAKLRGAIFVFNHVTGTTSVGLPAE